jgi:hypothetical protein
MNRVNANLDGKDFLRFFEVCGQVLFRPGVGRRGGLKNFLFFSLKRP